MDTDALPKNERTEKRWSATTARKVLDEFAASGMSQVAFARARGVTIQRLQWWRKRLGEVACAPAKVAFIPAEISSGTSITIRVPGGVAIEAASTSALPAAWVAELSRSLAGLR